MALPDPFDLYEQAVIAELRLVSSKLKEAARTGKFIVKFHQLQTETVAMLEDLNYEVSVSGPSMFVSFSSRAIADIPLEPVMLPTTIRIT